MFIRLATFTLLFSLLLTSFSVNAAQPSNRDFSKIIASGELRVGVSIFPPWVMRAKDGELIGSEIDMARRLAADMGLRPELGLYEWEQLIPALEKGDIDVIVSGMGIKPSRALRVNFSRPYGDAGIGLATHSEKTANFSGLDDLKRPSVNIGVMAETVSESVAKRMFSKASLKQYSSLKELEAALVKGDIHAMIAANPSPQFLALKHPGKIDVPLQKPLLSFKEGLAINKGDADFLNFLDAWVVSRSADGWITSTRHYWLETLEWQQQVP
ncbi:transporter substrate-binding domain-containing protein [Oceanicoccus sp. KOV_DT_Chl]|uniref:transporter substrate-binding domain-containing protein n=1 Tax=Oceanicoccus sp. KOV_DT_Chl TaxID=1904639 RepID=UPI000C7B7025|nr:transporter substrate-binding domain-containing protein [Oceanicoccus sp. KOV_DT_Chl]